MMQSFPLVHTDRIHTFRDITSVSMSPSPNLFKLSLRRQCFIWPLYIESVEKAQEVHIMKDLTWFSTIILRNL